MNLVVADLDLLRIEIDFQTVQHPQMLKVHRIGKRHPRFDRKVEGLDGAILQFGLLIPRKIGDLEQRLLAVERPDESPFFGGGKLEDTRRPRNSVRRRNFGALAVRTVLPMMERAAHILADNFPDPEIGTQVTAVGAHYRPPPALTPIDNRASLQEIAPNYLTRRYFIGARDRIPARMEPSRRHGGAGRQARSRR